MRRQCGCGYWPARQKVGDLGQYNKLTRACISQVFAVLTWPHFAWSGKCLCQKKSVFYWVYLLRTFSCREGRVGLCSSWSVICSWQGLSSFRFSTFLSNGDPKMARHIFLPSQMYQFLISNNVVFLYLFWIRDKQSYYSVSFTHLTYFSTHYIAGFCGTSDAWWIRGRAHTFLLFTV